MSLLFVTAASAETTGIYKEISDVLKYVESEHNPAALGDYNAAGVPMSYGILQIQQVAIDDVNKEYGTSYVHEEMFNISCAEEVFELYIKMWTSHLEKRLKRAATEEDIVRIWNGGPNGYKRKSTAPYLKKYIARKKRMDEVPLDPMDFIPPVYLAMQ